MVRIGESINLLYEYFTVDRKLAINLNYIFSKKIKPTMAEVNEGDAKAILMEKVDDISVGRFSDDLNSQ